MFIAQLPFWLHAILQPLKPYFDLVETYHDVFAMLALVLTAGWAIWIFQKSKQSEEAARLHTLFSGFYLSPEFRRLRNELEFDYDKKLRPLIEKVLSTEGTTYTNVERELLCDLDTSLNYFEFILHLGKKRHLARDSREVIFKYWYDLMADPDKAALQQYLFRYDYGELSRQLSPASAQSPTQIAFYGTLMHDQGAQQMLNAVEKFKKTGGCSIRGQLHDLGEFAGMVHGEGVVVGELYDVLDHRVLSPLDDYEEFTPATPINSLFMRQIVRLQDPPIDCWVYVYNKKVSNQSRVLHGDWAKHLRERAAIP